MLVLAGKKLKSISEEFQEDGTGVLHLDVSGNYLKSGGEFATFSKTLKTLIIDNNYFFSLEDFPNIPSLQTLSANKNNFNNLEMQIKHNMISFLDNVQKKFPNLIHLSLIKNPLCPMFIGEEEYQKYRTQVIQTLPKLQNLDGSLVDPREADPNYLEMRQQEKRQVVCNLFKQLEDNNEEEVKGTIEYNAKYSKPGSKTIKSRSEGNRFVKNNQL